MTKKSSLDVKAELGELDVNPQPGLAFPELLNEAGVEVFFGVHGGHGWRWIDTITKSGIKQVTMRHEMQAAHAAEAYARVSGKLGVCFATAGPGQTNLISGVHQAHLSHTPLLVLLAANEQSGDRTFTLQMCEAEKLFSNSAKFVKRLYSPNVYRMWITRAIRTALNPPRGPAVLEIEAEALNAPNPESDKLWVPNWLKEPIPALYPDPKAVERVLEIIYASEKPVIYAGDEIMWNNAQAELREFAKLAQVPVLGRRGARGAMPEDDPLLWKAASIGIESDLFVLLGGRLDFFDFWGHRFKIDRAVQIAEAWDYIHPWLPTDMAIQANLKVTLRAMNKYIKENNPSPPAGRASWLEKVRETERARKAHLEKRAQQFKDYNPIHPAWLSKTIVDTIDEMYKNDVYYVFDAFTGSNILSPFIQAKFAGQMIDSGCHAGVGHGVGQAIGASLGCDKKKVVFAMMGDAGMGLGGMDVETAVRHKLPIVFLVNNNDAWMAGIGAIYGKNMEWFGTPKGEPVPNKFIPEQRYDKMFEAIGCHGEWITEPDQIRGGLERSFKAAATGTPAVINVKVDPMPVQAVLDHFQSVAPWTYLPWNETTRWMRKARVKYMQDYFPFDKYGIEPEDYDRWDLKEDDFELGIPED